VNNREGIYLVERIKGRIERFCEESIFVTFEFLEVVWNEFLIIKESSKFCRKGLKKGRTN